MACLKLSGVHGRNEPWKFKSLTIPSDACLYRSHIMFNGASENYAQGCSFTHYTAPALILIYIIPISTLFKHELVKATGLSHI